MSTTYVSDSEPIRIGEPGTQSSPPRLSRRAYLNAVSSLLDYSAKVAVSLVITPFLVSSLGSSLFGVWQILTRLVAHMAAADGRPTEALKWMTANQQSNPDVEEKRRQVGSALRVWIIFLPVLGAVGAVLTWFAPAIARVPAAQHGAVRIACALLVFNFLLNGLVMLPEAVLRGMNLGYKRMGLVAGLNLIGGMLVAAAAYFRWGLVGIAGAQICLSCLTGVLFWCIVRKCVPWFGIAPPRSGEVKSFLRVSVWYFAWTLTNKLLLASDVVVLGVVGSTLAVTSYSLTSYAGLTLLSIISMILGAVTPGLGGVIGQKEYDRAAKLHGEMMTTSWLLVTAFGATILVCNRSFVSLWVGAEKYAGMWGNLLIVLLMAQLVFIRNNAYIIDLTLQQRKKVLVGFLGVVLSISLSVALIPSLGIVGLCLGLITGRMILSLAYPVMVSTYLKRTARQWGVCAIRPWLVTTCLFAGSVWMGERLHAQRSWECILLGGGTFALSLITAAMLGLTPERRASLVRRLHRMKRSTPRAQL